MTPMNSVPFVRHFIYSIVLGCCIASCGRPDATAALTSSEKSYGDLAEASLPQLLSTVETGIATLDSHTLPHETKSFRKEIGKLRDFLDLFVYAYPFSSGSDQWLASRKILDTGYEDVGHFKDLFDLQGITLATQDPDTGEWSEGTKPEDVEYDAGELRDLRAKVLKWRNEFQEEMIDSGIFRRLAAPDLDELYVREKRDLSRFFWGAVTIEPKASLSGEKNLQRLARHLLDEAKTNAKDVLKIDSLSEDTSAIEFHDFRKRIRSVTKLVGYFPQTDGHSNDADELSRYFVELVDGYGAINDLIVAREHLLAKDKKKKAKKLAEKIDELWDDLRKQQKHDDLLEKIEAYRDLIRDASAS